MASSEQEIWNDELLEGLSQLEWQARKIAMGILWGKHPANRLASGLEFAQYRAYVPGDDLRTIDWKMNARSGKYFVKQSQVESEQRIHVIVDGTPSMNYREDSVSKYTRAIHLAAGLTYLAVLQGDHFGWTFGNQTRHRLYGIAQWRKSLWEWVRLGAPQDESIQFPTPQTQTVYLLITDGYEDLEYQRRQLGSIRHPSNEIFYIHLVGKIEKSFDIFNDAAFIDLETKQEVLVNPQALKATYQRRYEKLQATLQALCYDLEAQYNESCMDDSPATSLRDLFYQYNAKRS